MELFYSMSVIDLGSTAKEVTEKLNNMVNQNA